MRQNLACNPQEVSEAYFFVSKACLRAAKPACAIKAIQRSVLRYPRCVTKSEWMGRLGEAYGHLGDASKMRDYSERALRIIEAHYGPDHPQAGITLDNLCNAYGALGDYSKRRDYSERALRILEAHYGPENVEVAKTL
eukprot:4890292-Amphidinium_carterae.1